MLILSRRIGETLVVGETGEILLTVLSIKGHQVRIGIKAPKNISVHREEVYQRIHQEKTLKNPQSKEQPSLDATE